MKILGIDPALTVTGWGVIDISDRLVIKHVANGLIKTNARHPLAERFKHIYTEMSEVILGYDPGEISIENTFVNMNGGSSLLLAGARAIHLLAAAMFDREIFEYAPNLVKKTITGNGHAEKEQVRIALKYQLKGCPDKLKDDESDALGVAITHASIRRIEKMLPK